MIFCICPCGLYALLEWNKIVLSLKTSQNIWTAESPYKLHSYYFKKVYRAQRVSRSGSLILLLLGPSRFSLRLYCNHYRSHYDWYRFTSIYNDLSTTMILSQRLLYDTTTFVHFFRKRLQSIKIPVVYTCTTKCQE